jgi:transcriptional regulator with XRE-family HTH domain
MIAEWFGARLRELREGKGLTQTQLAELAGVSFRGVAQWEQGVREPGWSSILALCQALDVTPDAFTQVPVARPVPPPGRPRKASAKAEATESPAKGPAKRRGQGRAGKAKGK